MYHVKATPTAPPGGLDLNIAEDEEFSPDKLRSNIERLYMTVVCTQIPRADGLLMTRRLLAWLRLSNTSHVYDRGMRLDGRRRSARYVIVVRVASARV